MKTIAAALIMLAILGLCYALASFEWAVLVALSILLVSPHIKTNEK
jgi:hypothetical protein